MQRAFTINEFCKRYEIGRTKAYEEIGSGRLICVKVGNKSIIREYDAEDWLKNLPAAHRPAAA